MAKEKLEDHDIAAVFPLLPEEELKELAKNIQEKGLINPILLYENKILDGRNRYRAILTIPSMAKDLDPECCNGGLLLDWEEGGYVTTYTGNDPVGHVISLNCHRRHLTGAQRAAIAAELANKKLGDNQHGGSANLPTLSVDQAKAAKLFNVSERSVRTAKAIKEADPELHSKVKSGEVSLNAAYKQIRPASESEPPRSWTAPEVSAEEENETIEGAESPSNPLAEKMFGVKSEGGFSHKSSVISRLKHFIQDTSQQLHIPKKEVEQYLTDYVNSNDRYL
jgi:ParB-like nuclease family protein